MTLGELRKLLADVPDEAEVWFEWDVESSRVAQCVAAHYHPTNRNYMRPPWTVVLS